MPIQYERKMENDTERLTEASETFPMKVTSNYTLLETGMALLLTKTTRTIRNLSDLRKSTLHLSTFSMQQKPMGTDNAPQSNQQSEDRVSGGI